MSDNDGYISLADALQQCIERGMSRRAAKRFLLKQLASGEVKARAIQVKHGPNGEYLSSGRSEPIAPEFFQGAWDDTEGDKGYIRTKRRDSK
jgi:topoisomerase IA-like protein